MYLFLPSYCIYTKGLASKQLSVKGLVERVERRGKNVEDAVSFSSEDCGKLMFGCIKISFDVWLWFFLRWITSVSLTQIHALLKTL